MDTHDYLLIEDTFAASIIGHETVKKAGVRAHVVYVIEVNRGEGEIAFVRRRFSTFKQLHADVRGGARPVRARAGHTCAKFIVPLHTDRRAHS